jgi:hypothetical protein
MIKDNEERQTLQNKLLLIYQYLKYYVRKYHTHHYYEVDLDLLKNDTEELSCSIEYLRDRIRDKIGHNVFSLPYKKQDLGPNYKVYENIPTTTEVSELLNMFINNPMYSIDDLLNIVFNINTTQSEKSLDMQEEKLKEAEEQTTIEKQKIKLKTIDVDVNKTITVPYRRLSIRLNPFKDIDEFIRAFVYINLDFDNNNSLIFSYNLINNISTFKNEDKENIAIIVEIAPNKYMLENISMISFYVYMFKIYNLNGVCINHFIFNTLPKKIDFNKIFNYKLVYVDSAKPKVPAKPEELEELNINALIFNPDEEPIDLRIKRIDDKHIMNDLYILINYSNISVFKNFILSNSHIIDKVPNYIDLVEHRLFNPGRIFSDYIKYIKHYYDTVSNYNTMTSNNKIIARTVDERKTKLYRTVMFSLHDKYIAEDYTMVI